MTLYIDTQLSHQQPKISLRLNFRSVQIVPWAQTQTQNHAQTQPKTAFQFQSRLKVRSVQFVSMISSTRLELKTDMDLLSDLVPNLNPD